MRYFIRLLSVLYFIGALLHLADLLDLRLKASEMDFIWKFWIVYLMFFDLAASIGLWKNRTWGIYLFLIIATSQLVAYLGFFKFFGDQTALVFFHAVTISIFFCLLFLSKRKSLVEIPSFESKQFIITGCPGSGKTTLMKYLRDIGFTCVDEPARQVIAEQRAIQGDGLLDRNVMLFTELLLTKSLESYKKHESSSTPIIFDRGIPDVVGYAKLFGLDTDKFENAAAKHSYNKSVFIAPPWKEIYSTDDERKMTFEQTAQFHEILQQAYLSLGYELIELPLQSVEKRSQFVVSFLKGNRCAASINQYFAQNIKSDPVEMAKTETKRT